MNRASPCGPVPSRVRKLRPVDCTLAARTFWAPQAARIRARTSGIAAIHGPGVGVTAALLLVRKHGACELTDGPGSLEGERTPYY
ncbi:MAG TPA: hypothetical protein ENJ82_03120 [Bacteroidetes bacterium]|nr:hypothetical protein [Bacteroidota bacterium]